MTIAIDASASPSAPPTYDVDDRSQYLPETEPLPDRGASLSLNITLHEHVVTAEMVKEHGLPEDLERGFTVSDRDFNRVARQITDARAFNTIRRACKLLMDHPELSAVSYAFDNRVTVTVNVKELEA